jgi:iron complex transport system substrate-binding protein
LTILLDFRDLPLYSKSRLCIISRIVVEREEFALNTRRTFPAIATLLLLVVLVLSACAAAPTVGTAPSGDVAAPTEAPAAPTEAPAEPTEAVVEEATEATAERESETVVVTHPQGETTITKNPQRVVVFDFSVLDTLDQLGIPVTGVPSSTNVPTFLSQYAGEEYTNVGTLFEPDYEKVNELQPDLILVALRSGPLYPDLSKIAPTVDLTVDGTNLIPSFKTAVTNIGVMFDKEAEVESRLAEIDASIARVNELATTTGQTALIVMVSGGEVTAFGPGSRFGIIHDVLGVTPISANVETETHGDAISFEYILEKNPDILFIIDRDAATGESSETAEQVMDNELIHSTNAWQNDKLVYLDPAAWYLANTGLGSMATIIAEVEAGLQ